MARGDHIKVRRRGYTHHGVDLGDGRVIHYSGLAESLAGGPVEVISHDNFADGRELEVVHHRQRLDPDEAVERARSRVGEDRYNVVLRNCEHFATWAVTGRERSTQVRAAAATLGTTLALALGVVVARGRRPGASA